MTAVGGGGKTSLVFALAQEAAARDDSAVVTTTTKFTLPAGLSDATFVESTPDCAAEDVAGAIAGGRTVIAHAGRGARNRLTGFPPEVAGSFRAGVIAIEGDGSAHRPFKAPGDHEPVIPATSTHVVVCVGLPVLGRPLAEEHVHRPELVAQLAGTPQGAPVTADTIVQLLLHEDGGRKGVPPGARLMALLNEPVSEEHRRLGDHIAARLVYGGFERAVVATAHRGTIHGLVR